MFLHKPQFLCLGRRPRAVWEAVCFNYCSSSHGLSDSPREGNATQGVAGISLAAGITAPVPDGFLQGRRKTKTNGRERKEIIMYESFLYLKMYASWVCMCIHLYMLYNIYLQPYVCDIHVNIPVCGWRISGKTHAFCSHACSWKWEVNHWEHGQRLILVYG